MRRDGFFGGSYGGDAGKLRPDSRLECEICWHVYDPAQGDDYWHIPPGTPFFALPVGAKVTHRFPSGAYEFILGDEEDLGRYQMCSLFSPVLQFADQPAAVATAQAVLAGLMDDRNRDETSMREQEIERIWRGDGEEEAADDGTRAEAGQTLTERLERPISRRDLLRGNLR